MSKKEKKQKTPKSRVRKWSILTGVSVILLAVGFIANYLASGFATVINATLGTETYRMERSSEKSDRFASDFASEEELVNFEKQLCYDIEGEGAALLLNRDNALPLAEGTKFTTFSQSSYNLLYGGTGSGQVNAADAITLKDALEATFGENTVNNNQWMFLANSGAKRVNAATTGGNMGQYRINEIPWSKHDQPSLDWANYGDVALVVLARSGGEGSDLPSGMPELEKYMTNGDYLQLCNEEKEMLANLSQLKQDGVFKKIVVLLNYSNALQLDFLDTYDIDAALWIGDVGTTGIKAVADILAGKINPSGRIVDTFLKDNHSAPAMANFGAYKYTNGADYAVATAQSNMDPGIGKCNQDYVVYQEGIYVGYRYYETRYEDYVLNQGNAGEFDYSADVAFPFGYGLSYTDFEYSNFTVKENGDHFEIGVDVKNTGSVDGKHTVQIYFQSPYTQYDRDNQVEKASVELCGFEKELIKAGATKHYTITVNKEDLTSYDANGAKTYIMDAGDYYFTVGSDAHNAVNNILMAKGADASRMTGSGNAALAAKWKLANLDKTTYAVSSATGNEITNRFEDADLNKYDGAEDQQITYLSRSDWTGTYPQTVTLRITPKMWADGLTDNADERTAIVEKYKAAYYPNAEMPEVGKAGNLTASMFADVEADSEAWDDLVKQIPYAEMEALVENGFHLTQPVASIGLPGTLTENGPQGFTKSLLGGASAMAYTSEDVMAATFNLELLNQMGKCIGEDFTHATDETAESVFAGIYGPGANIHRTPYCGRNFEYYSEDGWLAGEMAAAEVAGIQSRGVYVQTKHFALNDQEEGRYGISTWSNEQAIRELYLEGFEGSIVKGGGYGVMSSFNRLGVTWSGAHHGLMTDVLRNEWGAKGSAITDCSVFASFMDYRMGVLAGQDMWDGYNFNLVTLEGSANDPAIVTAVQNATKHNLYSLTHSHAMNAGDVKIVKVTPWWQTAVYVVIGLFAACVVASAAMLVISIVKLNRQKKAVKAQQK